MHFNIHLTNYKGFSIVAMRDSLPSNPLGGHRRSPIALLQYGGSFYRMDGNTEKLMTDYELKVMFKRLKEYKSQSVSSTVAAFRNGSYVPVTMWLSSTPQYISANKLTVRAKKSVERLLAADLAQFRLFVEGDVFAAKLYKDNNLVRCVRGFYGRNHVESGLMSRVKKEVDKLSSNKSFMNQKIYRFKSDAHHLLHGFRVPVKSSEQESRAAA